MENGIEWKGNFGPKYGRCQNGMEWKISRMEWKTIFRTFIPISYKISLIASAERYIRIVITTNMWKRLAANHLRQINRVIRS